MAYAALVSLAQTIELILNYHQDSISPQVKDQVIAIQKDVIFLKAFFEDFPDKANNMEATVMEIMEMTHVAEDIVEFVMMEQIYKSRYASLEWSVGTEESMYEYFRCDIPELKRATKKIKSIAEKVMEIKNSITVKDSDSTAACSSSRVAPVHKDAMVGFDDDLMEIKFWLCGEPSKLKVIPIVGMGGIGKTTLARNAYDDPLIMEHFQIRLWVTVSQKYNVQEISSSLLVSMKVCDTKNESSKEVLVYQNLKGRRHLIILDDIWSTKTWDDLKMMFPDDGNGSRIIFTTRLSGVASYADSSSRVHEMRLMDEDQSWNLLRQKVFKQDTCPVQLETMGKMIARSCRGLPLAIVLISGLLSPVSQTKNASLTENAWMDIARNIKSATSKNDEQLDEIEQLDKILSQLDKVLSLSYTHLPHHLRPCFLYMGGFPEDYKMRVSKLIKLWVAEGFLEPNGCKSLEETAEEYLEDLVKRSLVLVIKRKSNGRIKSFSIHDLIRDMCIRKTQEENFFLYVRRSPQEGMKIPRRVRINYSDLDFLENVYGSTIRTMICLEYGQLGAKCPLGYFRLLRILDLVYAFEYLFNDDESYPPLPAEVFELFHLRYLAFNSHSSIPAAISNLQNLQTLIICSSEYHGRFLVLPVEIWRMRQLRHVVVLPCVLPSQEEATFALENLQTLSKAVNFICSEEILKMIPNLKKLGIKYSLSRNYRKDYQLHNLVYLQHLENLTLEMYNFTVRKQRVNLAFPSTLKKLTLSGLRLPWEDMKIVGSLPNLEVLKLRDHACFGDTWETMEGEFSQLKFLLIDKSDLQNWITESSHFPGLMSLMLHDCRHLREIPDDIGEIPTLELIELGGMIKKSLMFSAKRIQDDQQCFGNYALQVRLVRKTLPMIDSDGD